MKTKIFVSSSLVAILLMMGTFWLGQSQAVKAEAAASYSEEGQLLKVKGIKGGAVYQVGPDGKKYVFPDQKTFKTWYDDFKGVKEVSVSEIDQLGVGGTVTFQPGSRLITHQNTSKVYAVGDQGKLFHVPDEATASELFGLDWVKQVDDIDPGLFASTYKDQGQNISSEKLPDGTLVEEGASGNFFLIEKQQKRKVEISAYGVNGLQKKLVVNLPKLPKVYKSGDDLAIEEKHISSYDPNKDSEKIVICHDPDNSIGRRSTIKISANALAVHLAHGDTQGACTVSTPIGPQPPQRLPVCENPVDVTRGPFRTTQWTDIGLDLSQHSDIQKYQIQWFAGHWSPWFTPGLDDLDWNNPQRRVWALFDDHTHRILTCGTNNIGPARPDFDIISTYILPPRTVRAGDTLTIVATVKNLGGAVRSLAGLDNWRRSLDGFEWLTDFTPERPVSADRPLYQNESLNFKAKGFFGRMGGMKKLTLGVDADNKVDELNEDNNQGTLDILVLGETVQNVDIKALSLSVEPSGPIAGANAVVKFEGKNSGDTVLTDTRGILNFARPFGDFVQTNLIIPSISTSRPLLPGQTFFINFLGYWETPGTKSLSFNLDNADELAESNEGNNWAYQTITVHSTSTSTSTPTYPPTRY